MTATAVLALLAEGGASVLMSVRSARQALRLAEEAHARYDPDLGWSHVPGRSFPDLYGPGRHFTTNAQGMRACETYPAQVPAGRYRVIFAGDSFTMGYGVSDDATFPAQVEALRPEIQSVNLGQGGYGLDQIYLWYRRDGQVLDSQVLVVSVIAHDFYRMGSDRFLGYAKPVLRVRADQLVVENVPVPATWSLRTPLHRAGAFVRSLAFSRFAAWLAEPRSAGGRLSGPDQRFYGDPGEEVFRAAGLALDELIVQTRQQRRHLVLVYLPSQDLLAHEPTLEARWMAEFAAARGVAFFNLTEDFGQLPPWELASLFRPDYHYTERGNRFVAERLLRRLEATVPGFPR